MGKELVMALVKTWYTVEEAKSKYGVDYGQIMQWVEQGLVRCERDKGKVVRVNVDDLRLELDELVRKARL